MPTKFDIDIIQGSKYDEVFVWTNEHGEAINLEGYSGSMQIRRNKNRSSELIHDVEEVRIFPVEGAVQPIIPSDVTRGFDFIWAYYDLVITPPSGSPDKVRLIQGRAHLDTMVTETGFQITPLAYSNPVVIVVSGKTVVDAFYEPDVFLASLDLLIAGSTLVEIEGIISPTAHHEGHDLVVSGQTEVESEQITIEPAIHDVEIYDKDPNGAHNPQPIAWYSPSGSGKGTLDLSDKETIRLYARVSADEGLIDTATFISSNANKLDVTVVEDNVVDISQITSDPGDKMTLTARSDEDTNISASIEISLHEDILVADTESVTMTIET